ncbi:glycosyltransferase [Geminocystis sp.]|uniref:glycosyltransferase n=1 Tax=Geminocystis sp. TaxID=2664100 RepID=UPI00359355D5
MNYSPIFISLIPNLMGGEGHIIPYHNSISQATKILGWHHEVIYSPEENLPNLPDNWHDDLRGNKLEIDANFFYKLQQIKIFSDSIKFYLKEKLSTNKSPQIIFIERFIHLQLFALWLSILFLPKNNLYIWVLYRHNFHQHKTKFFYKLLNKLLKKAVKSNHFHLFSDSQLLADSMNKYFEESFTVMPIPHTEFIEKLPKNNNNIICWWAGPPREEKGWQIIKQLSQCETIFADHFTLVTAKSADLIHVNYGVKIILTDDNLHREKYVSLLANTDIMLIPYDAIAYQERTSGVFTESVIAGNIPVTMANTWMAKELLKFGLDKLIINWDNPQQIWQEINDIFHNEEIKIKLKLMQKAYRDFHNLSNFARQFEVNFSNKI